MRPDLEDDQMAPGGSATGDTGSNTRRAGGMAKGAGQKQQAGPEQQLTEEERKHLKKYLRSMHC